MTTMRDVARHAGVSAKTVSRVFNNDRQVSKQTRQRVQQALTELDYVPNMLAGAFRAGRYAAIGVAIPDIADPFFAAVVRAVEDVAVARGMALLITSTGYQPDREQASVEGLLHQRVVGLISTPVAADQSYLVPWSVRAPIVFIDRAPGQIAADSFVGDDHGGALLAARHLLDHGHRRVAFFGDPPQVATARLRLGGYRAALAQVGGDLDDALLVMGDWSLTSVRDALLRLLALRDPPTAILSATVRVSISVVTVLRELDRQDLAIVGFGDVPLAAALTPALSVVALDPARLGRLAAERVISRLDHPSGRDGRTTVLPVSLVARGSGEVPARGVTVRTAHGTTEKPAS